MTDISQNTQIRTIFEKFISLIGCTGNRVYTSYSANNAKRLATEVVQNYFKIM